jgi:nitrogen regulatory protein P-II 1
MTDMLRSGPSIRPVPQDLAMRLVVAIVRPAQVEGVRQALAAIQVTRLTICDVHGYGPAAGGEVRQEALLEIAVNDDFVTPTLATLAATLGDGFDATRMFVLPIDETVQVDRAVRGPEAV